MTSTPGAAPKIRRYATVAAYNAEHPDALMPTSGNARNALRSFTHAGAGLLDDLTASNRPHTLDFLPGGAPEEGEPDRKGTVIATCWGQAPYLVLAEDVSLRQAWKAVTAGWPGRLSDAVTLLAALPRATDRPR